MKKGRVVVALLAAMAVSLVLAGCLGLGYAVSGQITDAGGAKIAGVTLTFIGGYGTATTGADGKWSKSGLRGTVTVTPAKAAWVFQPTSSQVTGAVANVDFTAAPAKILLYDDSQHGFAAQALRNLGYAVTTSGNLADFNSYLSTQTWHLVVADNPGNSSSGTLSLLKGFVNAGGRLAISTWQTGKYPSDALWATLGSTSGQAPDSDVHPVYKWTSSHQIFTTPNSVPNFTAMKYTGWDVDAFPGSATGTGTALGGIATAAIANNATIFVANGGRTVFNAFLLDDAVDEYDVANDVDADSKADAVEYWENQVVFLLSQPGIAAVGGASAGLTGVKPLSMGDDAVSNRK